ncbi:unnamed protein product [Absidia cylindrospora]
MEKLLQWAVNNSDQEQLQRDAEAVRRGDYKPDPSKFNPRVIEAILGKDDATRMKEAVQCMTNPNDTIENKEIAMDNFEMLIEGIDNAKNIQNMGLWPVLIQLLQIKSNKSGRVWRGFVVQHFKTILMHKKHSSIIKDSLIPLPCSNPTKHKNAPRLNMLFRVYSSTVQRPWSNSNKPMDLISWPPC